MKKQKNKLPGWLKPYADWKNRLEEIDTKLHFFELEYKVLDKKKREEWWQENIGLLEEEKRTLRKEYTEGAWFLYDIYLAIYNTSLLDMLHIVDPKKFVNKEYKNYRNDDDKFYEIRKEKIIHEIKFVAKDYDDFRIKKLLLRGLKNCLPKVTETFDHVKLYWEIYLFDPVYEEWRKLGYKCIFYKKFG